MELPTDMLSSLIQPVIFFCTGNLKSDHFSTLKPLPIMVKVIIFYTAYFRAGFIAFQIIRLLYTVN